ncbi:TRAP transporter fused permease subunit [Alphaproteobacteria bacterium GH1-50]|uniref:TRAP transporter fused permease subunit n=1 Tax=Kangsaoukella pontilimi TaxID=2691042 RepID=A0A7C9IFN5_9RHOB|nr:TRAP transporter fused permease subunit [Kangsaoukella pontilimi]MXQ07409.1 TRAP transporter fused permease subunit [Kangsaoukella pontilimi]
MARAPILLRGLDAVIALASLLLVGLTLYTAYWGVFPDGIQRSAHLLIIMVLVFAMALKDTFEPERARSPLEPMRRIWIVIALCAAVVTVGHPLLNFEAIENRYGAITDYEIVFGVILVIVLFDACRRTIGLPIVLLAGAFLLYGLLGNYLPAPLSHRGYSVQRVASQVYLGGGGIFGTPLGVSATFVTGVVVLGALLEKTGAGQVLMDFATALTGRMRGGPAKAAVVGSSLMGMISGTAVANVLTTGPISIPLMRKSGYRKEAAGAIEAVASTGGQLMPPVMGAAAFIMAEFTETSYLTIAKAAFLPAVIFYAVLLAMVHFEAAKRNIPILRDADSVTDWGSILKRSYLLLPLPVFVSMLLNGYSIMLSSFWAIVASVLVSYLSRASALTPRRIVETAVAAAQAVIPVALACAAAGVIIGVITLTGVGLKFSTLVVALSGGSLPVALVLTMLTCLVLGMGLPTAAAYILVATLVAPALVDLGVGLLAAHLFVLYSAMLSSITPPVALAAFAAASIAKGNPLTIAVLACQFGMAAFAVPYFFVYDPAILGIDVTPVQIVLSFVTAILGGICASAAMMGHFSTGLNAVERLGFAVAAVLYMNSDWRVDIAATVLAGALILWVARRAPVPETQNKNAGDQPADTHPKGDLT